MLISEFDYELPEALIARYPAPERRASRLLDVGDSLVDRRFSELPSLLRRGDVLVFNDTRVIPARLDAMKETGGRAEILVERVIGDRQALAHVRASKSPKPGTTLTVSDGSVCTVESRRGELFELHFASPVMSVLEACGEMPLPPYLGRRAEAADIERYQTVYARDPGAIAAPTAGLHFDKQMLDETRAMGVMHAYVTLHVGAGTFQSLRKEDIDENRLHSERVNVSEVAATQINRARDAGGRIIAVGTTAVRSLECAAHDGQMRTFSGETDLFIRPGYQFQCVDAVITNFHLPQSSLLMLVAAFAGKERILSAYAHAVRNAYRFFSYGDSMFLTPERD